jgi:hypothetical protein
MAQKTVRFCEALHAQIGKYRFFVEIDAEFPHRVAFFTRAKRDTNKVTTPIGQYVLECKMLNYKSCNAT